MNWDGVILRERLREGVKLPAIAPCVKYIKRHDGHRPSSFTLRSEERHSGYSEPTGQPGYWDPYSPPERRQPRLLTACGS